MLVLPTMQRVGGAQARDDGRVVGRSIAAGRPGRTPVGAAAREDLRAAVVGASRVHRASFTAIGHAGELAECFAALSACVERARRFERRSVAHRQERVELAAVANPRERLERDGFCADGSARDGAGELGDGGIERVRLGHSSTNAGTANPPCARRGASPSAASASRLGTSVIGTERRAIGGDVSGLGHAVGVELDELLDVAEDLAEVFPAWLRSRSPRARAAQGARRGGRFRG